MRLWSLHPQHLDRIGLVALWREGLLAQKVLQGQTKGYRSHPQLARFRTVPDPVAAVATYLHVVAAEAGRRGYRFDTGKLSDAGEGVRLLVTDEQLAYEWSHLLAKLALRSPEDYRAALEIRPQPHPLFEIVPGGIADWERFGPTRA
jgi:hypothetical protein